jgi:pantetheine-phosphate adenylyltransferase
MKRALFPGSFDPFTIGHESIVRRALPLFDQIIIAVGNNTNKNSYFTIDQRIAWVKEVFSGEPKILVNIYEGLTIEYCIKVNANYILRGLRTSSDFEYERAIAQMNRSMHPEIESVFLLTQPEYAHVASTIVRDIIIHGGDASKFLPEKIKNSVSQRPR